MAVAVELLGDHPLAAAVVRHGKEKLEKLEHEARDLKSVTGRGVRGRINGEEVLIGKEQLFDESDGPELPEDLRQSVHKLEQSGQTTMILRLGSRYLGVIGLMDAPRESASATILRLRELGITRMIMISGDNQSVADAVAREVGLDEAWGDLMPDDKVEFIKQLARDGKGGNRIAHRSLAWAAVVHSFHNHIYWHTLVCRRGSPHRNFWPGADYSKISCYSGCRLFDICYGRDDDHRTPTDEDHRREQADRS